MLQKEPIDNTVAGTLLHIAEKRLSFVLTQDARSSNNRSTIPIPKLIYVSPKAAHPS